MLFYVKDRFDKSLYGVLEFDDITIEEIEKEIYQIKIKYKNENLYVEDILKILEDQNKNVKFIKIKSTLWL